MEADYVFLTRVHRGILQAACFPESRKYQIDPFFLFLPLVVQEMPTSAHSAAPDDEAGRHFNPSKHQKPAVVRRT